MTDTAAIQAIINSSSKPFIPDGTYTIGRLTMWPNIVVEASPRATFIAAPGLNEPMIDMTGAHRPRWAGGHFTGILGATGNRVPAGSNFSVGHTIAEVA